MGPFAFDPNNRLHRAALAVTAVVGFIFFAWSVVTLRPTPPPTPPATAAQKEYVASCIKDLTRCEGDFVYMDREVRPRIVLRPGDAPWDRLDLDTMRNLQIEHAEGRLTRIVRLDDEPTAYATAARGYYR